jgi:hypothetical protein
MVNNAMEAGCTCIVLSIIVLVCIFLCSAFFASESNTSVSTNGVKVENPVGGVFGVILFLLMVIAAIITGSIIFQIFIGFGARK